MDAEAPAPGQDGPGEPLYQFSYGHSSTQTIWSDRREMSWPELARMLTDHKAGEKEGSCLVPAVFSGSARKKNDAVQIDIVLLDSDSGKPLSEIQAAIEAHGWKAVISSTHSHRTTITKAKRGNWDKYLADAGDMPHAAMGFLEEEKGYLLSVAEGAEIESVSGDYVFLRHRPCPKYRVALPLARPWRASAYDTQALANKAWKERIEALANALQLDHDQSCTDTSRLFYLPRKPMGGAQPEIAIIGGEPCDIFSLPSVAVGLFAGAASAEQKEPKAQKAKKAKVEKEAFLEYSDPGTGEVLDLGRWVKRYGERFEVVKALRRRAPGALVGYVADAVKHHIRCPNEAEHTNPDPDTATFVTDASQSTKSGFVIHCRHGHCDGRDRLFFLNRMLCQGWLKPQDLVDPEHLIPDGQDDDPAGDAGYAAGGDGFHAPPLIRIVAGILPAIVDKAERALIDSAQNVYQRGGMIVRPGRVQVRVRHNREVEGLKILELGEMALVEVLSNAADWEKYDARGEKWVTTDPPGKVAKALKERVGKWRMPVLTGVITAPTMRADGTILATPGYDPATGLILDPAKGVFPKIPEGVNHDDACYAVEVLLELIASFPFVTKNHRAVAISLILTMLVRPVIPTAPLHAFTAPVMGSGKSLMVDIAHVIAVGRVASVISFTANEEEFEKRLASLLLQGDAIIAIDNIEGTLGGDFLCSLLTQSMVRARILGKSEAPELPVNATVTATGNNLILHGDMIRRSLISRIDPQCERPELRVFPFDPIERAKAEREKYVAAALTIMLAYQNAGAPPQKTPLASYGAWSRTVRDALLWAGVDDPVETMSELRADDPKTASLREVMEQWISVFGEGREITARALIDKASEQFTGEFGHMKPRHPDLREALLKVVGVAGAINSGKLGAWLRANKNRVINGMVIEPGPQQFGIGTWTIKRRII